MTFMVSNLGMCVVQAHLQGMPLAGAPPPARIMLHRIPALGKPLPKVPSGQPAPAQAWRHSVKAHVHCAGSSPRAAIGRSSPSSPDHATQSCIACNGSAFLERDSLPSTVSEAPSGSSEDRAARMNGVSHAVRLHTPAFQACAPVPCMTDALLPCHIFQQTRLDHATR